MLSTRSRGARCTREQRDKILEYMTQHRGLELSSYSSNIGQQRYNELWRNLINELHQLGPAKSLYQWKTTWRDLKSRRTKAANTAAKRFRCKSAAASSNTEADVLAESTPDLSDPLIEVGPSNIRPNVQRTGLDMVGRRDPNFGKMYVICDESTNVLKTSEYYSEDSQQDDSSFQQTNKNFQAKQERIDEFELNAESGVLEPSSSTTEEMFTESIYKGKNRNNVKGRQQKNINTEFERTDKMDEIDHFALMIASKIRRIDNFVDRETVMNSIQNIVFKALVK